MVVSTAPKPSLRVLCLHGYAQDVSIFRSTLRYHMEELGDAVEFGPNKLLPYDMDGMENMARMAAIKSGKAVSRDMRSWYYLQSADPEIVNGLEKSFDYLANVLEEQGPFDGIIGFSQGKLGGLMAALITSMLEHRNPLLDTSHPAFKFAIISSGYKLTDVKWTHLYDLPILTPSLHVYGVLDGMIAPSRSMDLRDAFVAPNELCFVGAHFVPKTRMAVETISDFVMQFAPLDK
ncbi:hypothetical protein LPJ53_002588 [Coemansia erecta]|uniref:Serine hydrolase domain-containing protein n=1 Tax=Coemansia erecta TaxID=147472 RepID=A0A9W7Y386_9FUNG|nr:hypothetical protein LPJ53_002588 [Coemansia erecta]